MSKIFTITEGLENMGALRTGGQGSVYKGKRTGAIITAVKILPTPIHSENTEDKSFRNFKNEVEKLKKVNEVPNPNVVKILNSGLTESGSFPFIEMEYIEGPDLEELLKAPHDPVFTIRETIKLAEHLSNALCHCHRVGVKHGDIKSNNVKFNTATGNYILLDFGLAIMSDEQRRSSIRHAGAVEFMAPEQHDGEMFFQTDVYSFGIILFELLAGNVPFPLVNKGENSRNMVMLSHLERQVPDLLTLRKNNLPESWTNELKAREMQVPAWLLGIISKCLEKNPEKRYANGGELHEALMHHNTLMAAPIPVIPPPAEPVEAAPQLDEDTVQVSKPIFYVMILLLVALGLYTCYSLFLNDTDQKQVVYADTPLINQPDTVVTTVPVVDTANAIKPIILDTTVTQTNVDSLELEFEEQTRTPVRPVTTEPSAAIGKEPIIVSGGKRYQLPKSTLYFYESPDAGAAKKGVFGLWTNTKFTVLDDQNGFIHVTHTAKDGDITSGWLKKSDLNELQ